MPGGLLAFIPSDYDSIYLTDDPEISFFTSLYKRHSMFSIEATEETFSNQLGFGKYATCKLSKKGDLISCVSLLLKLSSLNEYGFNMVNKSEKHYEDNSCDCCCKTCLSRKCKETKVFGWINSIGHAIIDFYDIKIGGTRIDKQYGEWLEIWCELSQTSEKKLAYNEMVGRVDPPAFTADKFSDEMDLIIPLNFWFCRNIGLSLPCMSLYNEDIEIGFQLKNFDDCWVTNTLNVRPDVKVPDELISGSLLIDYIYLDFDERHKFYTEKQSYLIEQINRDEYTFPANMESINVDLTLNYCTKELIWVIQNDNVAKNPLKYKKVTLNGGPLGNDWFNFTNELSRRTSRIKDSFSKARIIIGGSDRMNDRKANYFRLFQPYFYHTSKSYFNNIYVYSFALRPEEHQPTGQFPFRNFDNTKLHIRFDNKNNMYAHDVFPRVLTKTVKIYSVSYNIFNVENGVSAILMS